MKMVDRMLRKLFNAEAPPPMIWEPQLHGRLYPDRPYFLTHIRQGVNLLPPELQASFKEAGYSFHLGRRVKSIYKNLDSDEYKKFPSVIEGLFSHKTNKVIFPQTNPLGTVAMAFIRNILNINTTYITAHELGHAFSNISGENGLFSKSPEFAEAYLSDFANISKKGKNILNSAPIVAYQYGGFETQKTREEVCAELFCENIYGRTKVSTHFPNTAKLIYEKMQQTCLDYRATNPDFDPDTYPKMEIAA